MNNQLLVGKTVKVSFSDPWELITEIGVFHEAKILTVLKHGCLFELLNPFIYKGNEYQYGFAVIRHSGVLFKEMFGKGDVSVNFCQITKEQISLQSQNDRSMTKNFFAAGNIKLSRSTHFGFKIMQKWEQGILWLLHIRSTIRSIWRYNQKKQYFKDLLQQIDQINQSNGEQTEGRPILRSQIMTQIGNPVTGGNYFIQLGFYPEAKLQFAKALLQSYLEEENSFQEKSVELFPAEEEKKNFGMGIYLNPGSRKLKIDSLGSRSVEEE